MDTETTGEQFHASAAAATAAIAPVSKMKMPELKAALQEFGLDTSGLKAVLVKRLEEARAGESAEPTPLDLQAS